MRGRDQIHHFPGQSCLAYRVLHLREGEQPAVGDQAMKTILAIVCVLAAQSAQAATECDQAAQLAAKAYGIPPAIMRAVVTVETGGTGRPWTANYAGIPAYHPTRNAAISSIRAYIARGQSNVDIGCAQVNWRWHSHRFRSLDHALDPRNNLQVAARILGELKAQRRTWTAAVGAYHAPNDAVRAHRYACKIAIAIDRTAELPACSKKSDTAGAGIVQRGDAVRAPPTA